MTQLLVKICRPGAKLPARGTPASVGLDVYAHLLSETGRPNKAIIPPRTTKIIPTGLIVKPEAGCAVFVCSRSGLAYKQSIFVTNAPGVVDPDYRGEIMVLLYNGGHESYYVQHEDRIAQLVVLPCSQVEVSEIHVLDETLRGDAGFGSTGR